MFGFWLFLVKNLYVSLEFTVVCKFDKNKNKHLLKKINKLHHSARQASPPNWVSSISDHDHSCSDCWSYLPLPKTFSLLGVVQLAFLLRHKILPTLLTFTIKENEEIQTIFGANNFLFQWSSMGLNPFEKIPIEIWLSVLENMLLLSRKLFEYVRTKRMVFKNHTKICSKNNQEQKWNILKIMNRTTPHEVQVY